MQEQNQQERTPRVVKWTSPEIIGEVVLLAVVVIFAVAYLVGLPGLKTPARILPLITIGFALPFFILRVKSLFERKKALASGQIMDLGFRFGGDPVGERRRAVRFIGAVAVLFIGLWVFGFHLFLPFWVVAYLIIFARVNPIIIIVIGLALEGLLLGVQDYIIDVLWPEPLFWQWIGVEYVFNDWPISETY